MKAEGLCAVYGASGSGRGVAPILEESLSDEGLDKLIFVDDGCHGKEINGLPVWSYEKFVAAGQDRKSVIIAIADGKVRERLALRCEADNIPFCSVVAKQHVRMKDVSIGEGAIFSPFTTLTSNIRIGRHFHCNIGSYVEHDCIIGDFVTFAPGVKCNGNIHIDDHVYIGAGAVLRQGTPEKPMRIGRGATIGMGAVVTKDVAPGAIVVGNPAKQLSG
ncbi:MAG: acetyltransferase [Pseudomonadota bacterium]